jgi:tRNA pseudouridine55 synthase
MLAKIEMRIDGILNVNKPEGKTSFSVVARLRALTGEAHVGHCGTLDPLATGVLPVCFGQATRVVQFLTDSTKTYLAQIELGITTDTFDRQGRITQQQDPSAITVTQVEEAISFFRGVIEQTPPIYSAVKHLGRPSYELARLGLPITLRTRRVEIISSELKDYQPPLITINVECTKGTYMRSLAHDIGQYLGCGAHLKNLVRLRCGPFHIQEAVSMSQIEDAVNNGFWENLIYSLDSPVLSWKTIIVDNRNELAIRNGQALPLSQDFTSAIKYCRAYNLNGSFIAVMQFLPGKNLWHPEKVFSPS